MDGFLLIPVKIVQKGGPGCGAIILGVIVVAIISFCNPSPTRNKNIHVETVQETANNTSPSSSARQSPSASLPRSEPSTSSTGIWVDNVRYFSEVVAGYSGTRFENHNDYPVRILWTDPDGLEYGFWNLSANTSQWTNAHISGIRSVRVTPLW